MYETRKNEVKSINCKIELVIQAGELNIVGGDPIIVNYELPMKISQMAIDIGMEMSRVLL
ncbi:MAG: hypothetical protein QW207_03730 [Candidatus Micrarchaeaceae archaeon]